MTKTILAFAALWLVTACGQEPAKDRPEPGKDLIAQWSSTGTETDPAPVVGGHFGQTVSTSGDWMVVTQEPTAGSLGRTEAWLHTSTGWAHEFIWTTPPDRHPVAVVTPPLLIIAEPCNVPSSTCQTGRFFGFSPVGTTWRLAFNAGLTTWPFDFGGVFALDAKGTLAVAGGGQVTMFYVAPESGFVDETLTEPATPYVATSFGRTVAVLGDTIAVGAPGGTRQVGKATIRSPGFVYLFNRKTGTVTTLTGVGVEGSTAPGYGFGDSLSASLDGKTLAVGAPVEVGRSLTTYIFRQAANGTWTRTNVIGPPSGASGTDISVAVDGSLGITTNAPGSTTQGLLRLFDLSSPILGAQLDASFALDGSFAPIDLRAGRVVVGQPFYLNAIGYVATYAQSAPVNSPPPP
jgi:hypothetical protein